MRLILNGINGEYLQNITANAAAHTEEVLAAVAYALDGSLLFDWCWNNHIPLTFYGRLDPGVAVKPELLATFLSKRSPDFTCSLVQHHHAKVIWWRGYGLYIGSANLSDPAWHSNVEAGCFFGEHEIADEMEEDILDLFDTLRKNATPLTEEVLAEMKRRANKLAAASIGSGDFWALSCLKKWPGLVGTEKKKAKQRRHDDFMVEWNSTLQQLRDIGHRLSLPENRPTWVDASAPSGAQADQFLHAHYYQRVMSGGKARYKTFFEDNRLRREAALTEAIAWWRSLPSAPDTEEVMLRVDAPYLQAALSDKSLAALDEAGLREIFMRVHAVKDYARRVPNEAVGLPMRKERYKIPEKVTALTKRIWGDRSLNGASATDLLRYILYDGPHEDLPERLWKAINDPNRKIGRLGVSTLGEMVGWALPEMFPPRNGRTSKALRSLGYDVRVHVE